MAKGRGVNRGRGIYFADDEWEALLEEVALRNYEERRPVSTSEVVREFVKEGIERSQRRRERKSPAGKSGTA